MTFSRFFVSRLLIVCSLLVGLCRFTVSRQAISWPATYMSLAHLLCGLLICLLFFRAWRWLAFCLLAPLVILEILMFVAG
jgi:hypothetical protein